MLLLIYLLLFMIVLEDEFVCFCMILFSRIYNFMIIAKINSLCNLSILHVKEIYSIKKIKIENIFRISL